VTSVRSLHVFLVCSEFEKVLSKIQILSHSWQIYSYYCLYKISWFNCCFFSNMFKKHWFADKKKLSSTCYLLQNIEPYLSDSTLKIIYFSLLHSVVSYSIIFWGNSSHSAVTFKMQKRVIKIIMVCEYR